MQKDLDSPVVELTQLSAGLNYWSFLLGATVELCVLGCESSSLLGLTLVGCVSCHLPWIRTVQQCFPQVAFYLLSWVWLRVAEQKLGWMAQVPGATPVETRPQACEDPAHLPQEISK